MMMPPQMVVAFWGIAGVFACISAANTIDRAWFNAISGAGVAGMCIGLGTLALLGKLSW